MQRSMMTMMPLMFAFFALQFSSGLSIYFITANIATIGQYMALNREKLEWNEVKLPGGMHLPFPSVAPEPVTSKIPPKPSTPGTPGKPTEAAEKKISRRKAKRVRARKAKGGSRRR